MISFNRNETNTLAKVSPDNFRVVHRDPRIPNHKPGTTLIFESGDESVCVYLTPRQYVNLRALMTDNQNVSPR